MTEINHSETESRVEQTTMRARCLVGTSGWDYEHWSGGVFYPAEIKRSDWFSFYCRHFPSVEINNSFYRLPEKRVFQKWYEAAPNDFTFAVKASRFITHMKKLAQPEDHVPPFLENAAGLREKLGVLLFQLPPYWKFNPDRLGEFFHFMGRQDVLPGLRSALEIRHKSWYCDPCFEVLRKYNISLALTDWPELPVAGPLTADFVFIRRHGPESLYASNYPVSFLKREAQQIRIWLAEGKDVFVYFNNDAFGYAVKNALTLSEYLEKE
jgi:uncharacterized protein YecE (DUF72 family)